MSWITLDLSDIGEGLTEAELVRWLVKEGDQVDLDQPVCEIQTDKAVIDLPSPCQGVVVERKWQEGERIPVGQTVLVIEPKTSHQELIVNKEQVLASPSTRRLAREHGINLSDVIATGENGVVLEQDVRNWIEKKKMKTPSSSQSFSANRSRIGQKLLYSLSTRPHATHFDEINVEGLVSLREQLQQKSPISYTPILLKIIACTLEEHPNWNAHVDEKEQKVETFSSISIGLATHTSRGLVVPVIRQVEEKNIWELAKEVKLIVEQIRAGKVSIEQMRGSTFTLSNAGGYGGVGATPIIQPPEVAILATHKISQKPVVLENGEIAARWRMNLSLSFDHRLFDGVDAIQFTQTFEKYTSNPIEMISSLR